MTYSNRLKFLPFYALSVLPMFMLYGISTIAFLIIYYLVKYRRGVVTTNLKNSFPLKNEAELNLIRKKFYRHFCDLMFESIKVLTISKKGLKKRFHIKNPELIQEYYNKKRSIVLYTAHHGNWEWLAFLPLFIPHQATAFYQPQSNKYFDKLMKILRERFGVICVESNRGYKAILEFDQKNILTMNYIIGDQSPRKDSTKHWIRFLNQDTAFLIGADRIAKKSNQVVLFPVYRKKIRGHYEVEFRIIEENCRDTEGYAIIDKYARLLEESINNSPEMWLWSHRRWKLKHS
jgi:Kdo2-lipid IVA lauroyltransferase/acyltransferase